MLKLVILGINGVVTLHILVTLKHVKFALIQSLFNPLKQGIEQFTLLILIPHTYVMFIIGISVIFIIGILVILVVGVVIALLEVIFELVIVGVPLEVVFEPDVVGAPLEVIFTLYELVAIVVIGKVPGNIPLVVITGIFDIVVYQFIDVLKV